MNITQDYVTLHFYKCLQNVIKICDCTFKYKNITNSFSSYILNIYRNLENLINFKSCERFAIHKRKMLQY